MQEERKEFPDEEENCGKEGYSLAELWAVVKKRLI